MPSVLRRSFLAGALPGLALAQSASRPRGVVSFTGDGVALQPLQYAQLLQELLAKAGPVTDRYLEGGAVQQLQDRFAELLGKEAAIFLPTGTMANHLAVRLLAGDKRRVLVQQDSHLYRDESDCAELISGLNLIPFTDFNRAVDDSLSPPYPMSVGAVSIESPIRRRQGETVPFDELKRITSSAKAKGIGTHLDGARVFLASAYTGISPRQYAALFDTVYVSLYKYFNAPFGAILAGPKELIAKTPLLRRQFGGGLTHAWEPALIAMHYMDGFEERFSKAVRNGGKLISLLETSGRFQFEKVPNGSNIVRMSVAGITPEQLRVRLQKADITLAAAPQLQINETINGRPVEEIAEAFQKALA